MLFIASGNDVSSRVNEKIIAEIFTIVYFLIKMFKHKYQAFLRCVKIVIELTLVYTFFLL